MIKHLLILLFFCGILNAQNQLHFKSLVIDLHADAIYDYLKTGRSLEHYSDDGHIDLDRLKEGGVDVQFFAIWPNPREDRLNSMFSQAALALDTLDQILSRNPERIEKALSAQDIGHITGQEKIAACIGLEGGSALEDNLQNLKYFYNRGVRYMGLTWNNSPSWASSAADADKKTRRGLEGLNDLGKKIVRTMNTLGMMVDVSHSSEKTFYDVLEISTKPVIASHSSVYSICPHYRNLKDDQIKALAKNGGVMGINFYPEFLVKDFKKSDPQKRQQANVQKVVDHIDYVVNLVGDDFVALGSDFDGITITPQGLENVTKMPAITQELQKRGYSEKSIRKILGENVMRVFAENSKN